MECRNGLLYRHTPTSLGWHTISISLFSRLWCSPCVLYLVHRLLRCFTSSHVRFMSSINSSVLQHITRLCFTFRWEGMAASTNCLSNVNCCTTLWTYLSKTLTACFHDKNNDKTDRGQTPQKNSLTPTLVNWNVPRGIWSYSACVMPVGVAPSLVPSPGPMFGTRAASYITSNWYRHYLCRRCHVSLASLARRDNWLVEQHAGVATRHLSWLLVPQRYTEQADKVACANLQLAH